MPSAMSGRPVSRVPASMALAMPSNSPPSLSRVQPGQSAGPAEYPAVRSHEVVPFQSSGDDYPVGGIAVQLHQKAGPSRDAAIHRYLHETGLDQLFSPGIQGPAKVQPAFLHPHSNLPERYGGNAPVALPQCRFHLMEGPRPQPPVPGPQPDDHVRVQEYQNRFSSLPLVSSNHSAGMGETMSPRISIFPRSTPNQALGFSL